MRTTTAVRITLSEGSLPHLELNGILVPVLGLSVITEPGKPALVSIDFESEDLVIEANPALLSSVLGVDLLGIIDDLDPKKIEAEALEFSAWDESMGEAVFRVLKEKLYEEAWGRVSVPDEVMAEL